MYSRQIPGGFKPFGEQTVQRRPSGGSMWTAILAVLKVVIANPDLHEKVAGPVGDFLKAHLGDVEENAIADFLTRVANHIRGA